LNAAAFDEQFEAMMHDASADNEGQAGRLVGVYAGRRKRMDLVYAGEVDHGFDRSRTAD
jgi:hypothetical protein